MEMRDVVSRSFGEQGQMFGAGLSSQRLRGIEAEADAEVGDVAIASECSSSTRKMQY